MRKVLLLITIVVAMAMFAGRTYAYTQDVDGITWNYVLSAGEAYVSGPSYSAAIPVNTVGAITIPSSLGGHRVTRIGDLAFMSCYGLTSVTIPDSVTSIGNYVFAGCSGIRSVTIPQSVCSLQLSLVFVSAYQAITNVVISDGVTSIGDNMFEDCSCLTHVAIPNSLARIGQEAFEGCNAALFDTITIPGVKLVDGWAVGTDGTLSGDLDLTGVRGLGDYAFEECTTLTSVTVPSGVGGIGYNAFGLCHGLTSVSMPNSVTNIDDFAFFECTNLTSVTIPAEVTRIGEGAFENCSGLTNVMFMGNAPSVSGYAFQDVASGCIAYVSPSSTGWGVEEGGTWHGLTLKYWEGGGGEVNPVFEIVDVAIEVDVQGLRHIVVGVVAKDGEQIVQGDASKVAFEATSDLHDWVGAAKLTPTVEELQGNGTTLRFRVTPGDGTATRAFLRIRHQQ